MGKDNIILNSIPKQHRTRIKRGRTVVASRKNISRKDLPPTIVPVQKKFLKDAQALGSEVYIVGGGSSLTGFDFKTLINKCTIAVNKSVFNVPNRNYFVTVDYTFLSKIRRESFDAISTTKFFIADFGYPFMKEVNGVVVDSRYNMQYDIHGFDALVKAKGQEGIGYTFADFRTGTNSGFCALQLAVILGFKKIHLLGIDLNHQGNTHYHGGYGEHPKIFNSKLDAYFNYFKIGLEKLKQERPGIKVVSCSKDSRLNEIIPYVDLV